MRLCCKKFRKEYSEREALSPNIGNMQTLISRYDDAYRYWDIGIYGGNVLAMLGSLLRATSWIDIFLSFEISGGDVIKDVLVVTHSLDRAVIR